MASRHVHVESNWNRADGVQINGMPYNERDCLEPSYNEMAEHRVMGSLVNSAHMITTMFDINHWQNSSPRQINNLRAAVAAPEPTWSWAAPFALLHDFCIGPISWADRQGISVNAVGNTSTGRGAQLNGAVLPRPIKRDVHICCNGNNAGGSQVNGLLETRLVGRWAMDIMDSIEMQIKNSKAQ